MFAMQRSEKILELLHKNETVQVHDLVKLFNVSDVTVRKDLKKLHAAGIVTKTHGGAILKKSEIPVDKITTKTEDTAYQCYKSKKDKLAKFVCGRIKNGDTIFLGSGYACVSIARQLPKDCEISVITHNIEAIPYLKDKCKTLILLGGEVITYGKNFFTSSSDIHEQLEGYNINKAITSCSGIDLNFGISFSTEASKKMISSILKSSQGWYLIADSSKFNSVSPYKISSIDKPEMIVTESLIDEYKEFENIIEL